MDLSLIELLSKIYQFFIFWSRQIDKLYNKGKDFKHHQKYTNFLWEWLLKHVDIGSKLNKFLINGTSPMQNVYPVGKSYRSFTKENNVKFLFLYHLGSNIRLSGYIP